MRLWKVELQKLANALKLSAMPANATTAHQVSYATTPSMRPPAVEIQSYRQFSKLDHRRPPVRIISDDRRALAWV